MSECRNCGSSNLRELGFCGEVAPFFLKRVLNLELGSSVAHHPLRLFARRVLALPRLVFDKVYGRAVFDELQICLHCSFVQVKHPFSDEALSRLYFDYRSGDYNRERIHYEPTYAKLADSVGVSEQEVGVRVRKLTEWLAPILERRDDFSMLDFGGSDGRFLPELPGRKFVFEISDSVPKEGVTRIAKEADLTTYDYVQVAHVLEHVSFPLELLKKIAKRVKPSGYLYIEVPQELPESEFAALKAGKRCNGLPIHEHINFYSQDSVAALIASAGLEPTSLECASLNLGWTVSTVIRGLCRQVTV